MSTEDEQYTPETDETAAEAADAAAESAAESGVAEADEDIAALEDVPPEEETSAVITGEGLEGIRLSPDTPVYRLRLLYSNETFLAVWPGEPLAAGSMVVVPTRYGRDLAKVLGPTKRRGPSLLDIARVVRPAGADDLERARIHKSQEEEAYHICRERIRQRRVDMKLVSVHYLLEEPKMLFFFTSESRVDFRDLIKDLVGIFKIRVELRQIGARDESRVMGGMGPCGRCYCCHAVSDKLKPVSIKMAKDQGLSLNSMKISGACGRLLCCLAYEHLFYNEQRKVLPPDGCRVSWNGAQWRIAEVNAVMGRVRLADEEGRVVHLPASAFEKVEGRWSVRTGAESG